jgi:hypothetical protein
MKILFEGTESQITNLLDLIAWSSLDLPATRRDYQTANLWCTRDVKSKYECTEEEALEVLEEALTNPAIMEYIWFAIGEVAEEFELQPKDGGDE